MDEEELGTESELEPHVGDDADVAEGEPEPKKKRKVLPLVLGIVGVLLLLGGAAFGVLFFMHIGPFAPPPVVETPAPPMPPGHHMPGQLPGKPGSGAMVAKGGPGGKPGPGVKAGGPGGKPGAGPKTGPAKPVVVAKKPAPKPEPVVSAIPAKPVAGQIASVIGLPPPKGVRADPFSPYRNLALENPPPPSLPALPPVTLSTAADNSGATAAGTTTGTAVAPPPTPAPVTSPWHVAGIMTGDGIRAIMEKGDDSQVVQPGDQLHDGSANVVSITDSQVTLRTTGNPSADIALGVTAGDTTTNTNPQGAPTQ